MLQTSKAVTPCGSMKELESVRKTFTLVVTPSCPQFVPLEEKLSSGRETLVTNGLVEGSSGF